MTARQRKNRSASASCEICGETCILHCHHISGRKIENPHHPDNLVDICPNCHVKVHAGMLEIHGWLRSTEGKSLEWRANPAVLASF